MIMISVISENLQSFWMSIKSNFGDLFDVLNFFNLIIAAILFVAYFYQNVYAVMSIFTKKRVCKQARKFHKYAYVICAHDEENVVGHLIDSIFKQNYPTCLMTVFVVADNCKDNTAQVARDAGAIVFERTSDQKGKSYALDFCIKKMLAEYEDQGFEAMFVFDADNLVSEDYTARMNDLFDHGVRVATSYRESKNFNENWVSAGSSMCFYRECIIVHHSRCLLNIGTFISGTGYYIDYALVKEMGGWNYHTMVEDIEFSCDCAEKGIRIGFCEDAVFYDEQPTTFKSSINQRLRWCKGTHQCFYKYKIKKRKQESRPLTETKYEMDMQISPLPIINLAWLFIYAFITVVYTASSEVVTASEWVDKALPNIMFFLLALYGFAFLHALIVTAKRHNEINAPLYKQILYCFTFPIFAASFLPLSVIALFKKVTWKKVEHTYSKSIEDMQTK